MINNIAKSDICESGRIDQMTPEQREALIDRVIKRAKRTPARAQRESTARDTPEGPGLTHRFEYLKEFLSQLEPLEKEVWLQATSIILTPEHARPLLDRQNAFRGRGIVGPPPAGVLFRPEEVHVVSRVGPVVIPARGRQVSLPDHRLRQHEHHLVPHAQLEGLGAVETASIDLDVLTRK